MRGNNCFCIGGCIIFGKIQESLKKGKDERHKKRLEKKRIRLEQVAADAAREKERLQQEAQKIQAEKDRLLSLDDKGLMVELVLAMRGLYSQIEEIQIRQDTLTTKMKDIESDISSIREDISDLESRMNTAD